MLNYISLIRNRIYIVVYYFSTIMFRYFRHVHCSLSPRDNVEWSFDYSCVKMETQYKLNLLIFSFGSLQEPWALVLVFLSLRHSLQFLSPLVDGGVFRSYIIYNYPQKKFRGWLGQVSGQCVGIKVRCPIGSNPVLNS